MAYGIGVGLALVVAFFATGVGLDRDRAFYPTVMIVIASNYALFAAIGGSVRALGLEALPIAAFVLVAVLGFKRNLWWVVAALAAHGLFDCIHGSLITNPGVPVWWPMFCLTYDIVAAGYLACRLWQAKMPAAPSTAAPSTAAPSAAAP